MSILRKIVDRYKGLSLPVKSTIWFTICGFLQRGVSMITTPVFTRILPVDEYGLYSTYISWLTVLTMIVSLCLFKALMNLYVKYDNKDRILSGVCGLEMALTSLWLVVGLCFRNQLSKLLKLSPVLVCCLFVYIIFQSAFQCWSLHKRYIYDYRILVIVTLVMTIGSAVLGILAVTMYSKTAEARAVTSTIVVAIIGAFLYYSIFRKSLSFYDKSIWLFSLGFCLPLLPHYLSEFILQSSDKIMINYMCGSRDVAIYSIAYAAGSLITLITNAINSSFAPYQYQKIAAGDYGTLAKRANQVLIFVGLMLILIMLFCREIVLIFGGHKYEESASVIIPICLGVYFNYMFQLFARVQEYYERKITVVIPSILCAVLNLILNYYCIMIFGYKAAAYTTFLCYFLFCIVHYFFYRRVCIEKLGGQRLYNIESLVCISVIVIISGVIISFINQMLWLKYGLLIIVLFILIFERRKLLEGFKYLNIVTKE